MSTEPRQEEATLRDDWLYRYLPMIGVVLFGGLMAANAASLQMTLLGLAPFIPVPLFATAILAGVGAIAAVALGIFLYRNSREIGEDIGSPFLRVFKRETTARFLLGLALLLLGATVAPAAMAALSYFISLGVGVVFLGELAVAGAVLGMILVGAFFLARGLRGMYDGDVYTAPGLVGKVGLDEPKKMGKEGQAELKVEETKQQEVGPSLSRETFRAPDPKTAQDSIIIHAAPTETRIDPMIAQQATQTGINLQVHPSHPLKLAEMKGEQIEQLMEACMVGETEEQISAWSSHFKETLPEDRVNELVNLMSQYISTAADWWAVSGKEQIAQQHEQIFEKFFEQFKIEARSIPRNSSSTRDLIANGYNYYNARYKAAPSQSSPSPQAIGHLQKAQEWADRFVRNWPEDDRSSALKDWLNQVKDWQPGSSPTPQG